MRLEEHSLKGTFFKFVIPSILSQWVYALYTMVDGMFVAKGVGPEALTAVNLSTPFLQMLFAVSLLFAAGTSTVSAIFLGEGQRRRASEVFTQNVAVQVLLSGAIIALALPNLGLLIRFLGAQDARTAANMKEYLGLIIPFVPGFLLSYAFEVLMKTDGYPRKTMAIVLTGALENCFLDWLFVIVLQKGLAGAAFATSISQCTVTLLYLIHFLGARGEIRFVKFKVDLPVLVREMRNGTSAALTELSAGSITLIFNRAIAAVLFPDALVSYAIVSYINSIVVFSVTGIVQGSQPLISYCLGRGDEAGCRRLLRYSLATSLSFCTGTVLLCTLLGREIASFYIGPGMLELLDYSVAVMRIFILSLPLLGLNIVLSGYFSAVEYAVPAMLLSIGRGFVFLLLSLALLTSLMEGAGIWWAPLLSEGLCFGTACMFLWTFRNRSSVSSAPAAK